jgi:hypothetical protein
MNKTFNRFLIALVIASFCAFPLVGRIGEVQAQESFPPTLEPYLSADGLTLYNGVAPLVVVVDPNPAMQGIQVPAEPEVQAAIEAAVADPDATSAAFSITYKAAGTTDPWGAVCQAFPSNAKTAFNAAAAIWHSTLQSSVPITISACWSSPAYMPSPGTLGYSGGAYSYRNFPEAPKANTWYESSLANALHGSDLNASAYDDYITYNSGFSWYYGTDGHPTAGTYDLVTVAAHEIAHGLNFSGTAAYSAATGSIGSSGSPNIYDTFMENSTGTKLTSLTSPSTTLGSVLTSGSLWFNGTNSKAANGGSRVKIYAPSSWKGGSSYAHLDYTTFAGTANSMMVYAVSSGSAQHNPGPVTKGLLKDLGWVLASSTPTTVPTPISPSGTISDKTPTYTWTKVTGATQYRYQLVKGTTIVYTKIVSSSACGTSTCSNTPTTTLSYAAYKWRVQAYVGGAWKTYSAYESFTVATTTSTAFNSQFTSNASGWTPVNGTWSVGSGYYQTLGLSEKFVTSKHSNNYNVLTYEVKLKRTGCELCSNGIYFNGAPSPITSAGRWNKGYAFYITNDGRFKIGRYSGGTWTNLTDWTYTAYITSSWNTLKVTYNSSTHYVQFYINGYRVAYGTFGSYTSGQVGVGFYRDTSSGNKLYVDYAKLSLTAPSSILAGDGIVIDDAIDMGVMGDSDMMSP